MEAQHHRCQNEHEAKALKAQREKHLNVIIDEQLSYSGCINNAVQFPSNYLSLTIDGMECTHIPHHVPPIKKWMHKNKRYGLQVFGIMDHGHHNVIYYYPAHAYSKGSNAIISILYTHLQQYISQPDHAPVLYLQADNCYGENKNRMVLAFLSFLVAKKIFTNIYYHFLPAGHTHADVDQMFSVLRQSMDTSKCIELPSEMVQVWSNSYQDRQQQPDIIEVPRMYDWKTWFEQVMNDMRDHINPRAFHFHCTGSGKAVFKVKSSATRGNWSEEYCLLDYLPASSPIILEPRHMSDQGFSEIMLTLQGELISPVSLHTWQSILAKS